LKKYIFKKIIHFINFVNARAKEGGLPFGYLAILCGNYL